jgi:hypothetical protein
MQISHNNGESKAHSQDRNKTNEWTHLVINLQFQASMTIP